MDLNDNPESMPLASETIVIMPDNQGDITKANGTRNIKFFLPDYVGYFLPSQSNLKLSIKMSGRGNPIPDPSAGIHSMFNVIRTYDGTNSQLLEEFLQYNTYVAQCFQYTKTNAMSNYRMEFEGQQSNNSIDGNLYWTPTNTTWSQGALGLTGETPGVTKVDTAKSVQILTHLKTDLYSSDEFVPASVFRGLRTEFQVEDYRRALTFTTGNFGFENPVAGQNINAMCPMNFPLLGTAQFPAGGPDVAFNQFELITVGNGYTAGNIYACRLSAGTGGDIVGYVLANTVTAAPANSLIVDTLEWYAGPQPLPGQELFIDTGTSTIRCNTGVDPAGAAISTIPYGVGTWGKMRKVAITDEYYFLLGSNSVSESMTGHTTGGIDSFGTGTLKNPERVISGIHSITSGDGYGDSETRPGCTMPYSVGDKITIRQFNNTEPVSGVISKISRLQLPNSMQAAASKLLNVCKVAFIPEVDVTAVADNTPAPADAPAKQANSNAYNYAWTNGAAGYIPTINYTQRLNGYTAINVPANLVTAAAEKVDFTISDMQMQLKRVELDERKIAADLAAANSPSGYRLDLPTVQTSLVNVQQLQGPTNQLITIPNITRALGVLSVPLNQNHQLTLEQNSFFGFADHLSNYQYELGSDGLQPERPVPVEKATLGNPLMQTQMQNELIKAGESFGYFTSNLYQVVNNFAIGRQFARTGMYYNLMQVGDLVLKCQYDVSQTSPKLFCHFVKFIRSIVVSQNGINVSN